MTITGRATATAHTATAIFYPETDGLPLPDGMYQAPLYVNAFSGLQVHFSGSPNTLVSGNTLLYYVEGDPRRVVSPDCYVVFDLSDAALHSVSQEGNNTYLLWEVGKPPDFVLEIASPSTARNDLTNKRDLYARLGIGEYWLYDQTGGDFYDEPLLGQRLVDGKYEHLDMHNESDGSVWAHSDALNLDLWWVDGELRYWDSARRKWLLNHQETDDALHAAEARRAEAEARASSERDARLTEAVRADAERDARLAADARADEAEARAAQLEAELRRLRGL